MKFTSLTVCPETSVMNCQSTLHNVPEERISHFSFQLVLLHFCAVLHIGRSLVRFQMVSLELFIDIKSFRSHYGPGVDSASNRNEYQEYFLGVKGGRSLRLTTLPPSCAVVTKSGSLNSFGSGIIFFLILAHLYIKCE